MSRTPGVAPARPGEPGFDRQIQDQRQVGREFVHHHAVERLDICARHAKPPRPDRPAWNRRSGPLTTQMPRSECGQDGAPQVIGTGRELEQGLAHRVPADRPRSHRRAARGSLRPPDCRRARGWQRPSMPRAARLAQSRVTWVDLPVPSPPSSVMKRPCAMFSPPDPRPPGRPASGLRAPRANS